MGNTQYASDEEDGDTSDEDEGLCISGNLAPVSKEVLTDWLFRHLVLYEKRPNETEEQARERLTVEDGWLLLQ